MTFTSFLLFFQDTEAPTPTPAIKPVFIGKTWDNNLVGQVTSRLSYDYELITEATSSRSSKYLENKVDDYYYLNLTSGTGVGQINTLWYTQTGLAVGLTQFNLSNLPQIMIEKQSSVSYNGGDIKAVVISNLSADSGTITLPFAKNNTICGTSRIFPSGKLILTNANGWKVSPNTTIDINLDGPCTIDICTVGATYPVVAKGIIGGTSNLSGLLTQNLMALGIGEITSTVSNAIDIYKTIRGNIQGTSDTSVDMKGGLALSGIGDIVAETSGDITLHKYIYGTMESICSGDAHLQVERFMSGKNILLQDNLIAFYDFEEADTGVRYSSISDDHLHPYDSHPIPWTYGKQGRAVSFQGAYHYNLSLAGGGNFDFTSEDFTMAAWFKPNYPLNNASTIISRADLLNADSSYYLAVTASNRLYFLIYGVDDSHASLSTYTNDFNYDEWNLAVAWRIAESGKAYLQLNNYNPITQGDFNHDLNTNTTDFVVGGSQTSVSRTMDGDIDSIAIWDRSLDTNERTKLWNAGHGWHFDSNCGFLTTDKILKGVSTSLQTDLLGYWMMNETGGIRADSSANTFHLSEYDDVTAYEHAYNDYCIKLSGTPGEILYNSGSDFHMNDTDFTICAYIYPTGEGFGTIAGKYYANGNEREYALYQVTNAIWFGKSTDGTFESNNRVRVFDTFTYQNTWLFVAGLHDSVNNTMTIKINQLYENSINSDAGIYTGVRPFTVGGEGDLVGNTYRGKIDNVGVWKRLLSDSELDLLYTASYKTNMGYPSVLTVT